MFMGSRTRLSFGLMAIGLLFSVVASIPATPAVAKSVKVSVLNGRATAPFLAGSTVALRANPASAGFRFSSWRVVGGSVANPRAQNTTLTIPAGAAVVVAMARYERVTGASVRLSVIGGSGSGSHSANTAIEIEAVAGPGQVFQRWQATHATVASATSARTTANVTSGRSRGFVRAIFGNAPQGTVTLDSLADGGDISAMGETVFGKVASPQTVTSLTAKLSTNNRTIPLQVDRATGQFALRLFEGDVKVDQRLTITFTVGTSSGAAPATTSVTLTGRSLPAAYQMVAGRLTFGATPALMAELRTKGYEAWVREQLNPVSIDNSAFERMGVDALYRELINDSDAKTRAFDGLVMHAVHSRRQLLEVMTVFWDNHFWTQFSVGGVPEIKERQRFREKALGKFEDLLLISATSPAMLQYLNNTSNRANANNENYARELLELHTVGVNGGYDNTDVAAVARIMTGWNMREVRTGMSARDFEFHFNSQIHDTTDKYVPFLKRTFQGRTGSAGIKEGEELLSILANHPSTQNFVCGKIVRALASDDGSPALVDKCVAAWRTSDGTVAKMLEAILLDPTYLATVSFQKAKAKTPLEYFAGYLRHFGAAPLSVSRSGLIGHVERIARGIADSGMDWRTYSVPTGFKDDARAWLTTTSFLARFDRLRGYQDREASRTSPARTTDLNFTRLLQQAGMTTPQAAAAYLLALAAADRYRQDEYDAVVKALTGSTPFDLGRADAEDRIRSAVRLVMTLPSAQIQ